MTPQIIGLALADVEYISMISFTGGEPSLASEVIERFLQECLWKKITFGAFYIVTNGKTRNGWRKFMAAVDRLYSYADSPEACCLSVSRDQYHTEELYKIDLNKFYRAYDPDEGVYEAERPYLALNSRTHPINNPLREGRAVNKYMTDDPEQQSPWVIDEEDNGRITFPDSSSDLVYVAANGNVVSSCNMSFRRADQESKGNVLTQSLPDIIRGYSKPYVEQEEAIAI
jgi:organic radical activating enzyme